MSISLYYTPRENRHYIKGAEGVAHALKEVFGGFPIEIGRDDWGKLMAMHHAYNAARLRHGDTSPFGVLADAVVQFEVITVDREV